MAPAGKKKGQKVLSRKERRKQERAAKKQRKVFYHSKQGQTSLTKREVIKRLKPTVQSSPPKVLGSSSSSVGKRSEHVSPKKAALLSRANERERKEIATLEKLLKVKKKDHLPKSFQEDGLDYLLDLTDKDSGEWNLSDDDQNTSDMDQDYQTGDSDSEPEEVPTGSGHHGVGVAPVRPTPVGDSCKGILNTERAKSTTVSKKKVNFNLEGLDHKSESDSDEGREMKVARVARNKDKEELLELDDSYFDIESIESDDEEDWGEGGGMEWEGSEEEQSSEEEEEEGQGDEGEESKQGEDEGAEEDCDNSDGYLESEEDSLEDQFPSQGVRGDQAAAGSDRTVESTTTYVPPHLRETGKVQRLKKRVQGLLNRLSESNMKSISTQMEQLYRENSRNDMNVTVWEVLSKACVGPVLITDRFALEQTMLVAILHHHVGTEVGAHVVQNLVVQLAGLLEEGQTGVQRESKEMECLVLLLAHLYNYRVIHCLLIYDLIRKLVETFSERDVGLLLLLLKNTGLEIRRDDAKSLKDIILQIQSKAADSANSKTPRMKFMLDTISALRTNNARKIPNYDPSLIEHMKKLLRGLLRTSGSLDEAQLKVSLQDLLNADHQGRWWVVGSAWTGRDTNVCGPVGVAEGGTESWVLDLARKQRMNTDVRKKVFSVIMTSEDFADGFQKLVGLGLKDVQQREVVHVLVDCCLQEKTYNPYYAYLGQKLCEFKKSNQVTFQYSLWDRFKSLDSLSNTNLTNLRLLCLHLITKKALSLAILKVVEFTELSKEGIKFFKRLLHCLLTEHSEAVVREVFARIAPLPHLKKLHDSLLVFLTHYVGQGDKGEGRGDILDQRIKMIEHALRTEGQLL